jgi:protein-disulfide isomerase
MGVRILSHPSVFRLHSGKPAALQTGRFMLRDLHGPVRFSNHSDAFTDILFGDHRITACLEKEACEVKKQYIVLISSVSLAVLFVLGSYLYKQQQIKKFDFMAKSNASTFVREYSQTLGSDEAKVYLVEFADPACETCASFYPFVKRLMADNPGKIKLVMRYAPFHKGADYFVKILEAARKQGKYWETLKVMYKTQPYWASHDNPQPQLIWQLLRKTGLNLDKIKIDMNEPEFVNIIKQDLADAKTLNVKKTPSFFVNGKPLQRFGRRQLKELVESEIRAQYQ